MNQIITRAEYLALVGLKTLADRYYAMTNDVVAAAGEILQEADMKNSPIVDVFWCGASESLDDALALVGVVVERSQ